MTAAQLVAAHTEGALSPRFLPLPVALQALHRRSLDDLNYLGLLGLLGGWSLVRDRLSRVLPLCDTGDMVVVILLPLCCEVAPP